MTRKMEPHEKCSRRYPPASGPIATPSPDSPAQIEMARARSSGSPNTFVRMDSVLGMMNAAPKPCSARVVIKTPGVPAQADASEPAANKTRPAVSAVLRPKRSPRLPARSRKLAKTSVYASTIHCSALDPAPSSRTNDGSATLTIVPSMPTISRLTHSTARIHQRRGSGVTAASDMARVNQPERWGAGDDRATVHDPWE